MKLVELEFSMMEKISGKFYIVTPNGVSKKWVKYKDVNSNSLYEYDGYYILFHAGKIFKLKKVDEFTIWKISSTISMGETAYRAALRFSR